MLGLVIELVHPVMELAQKLVILVILNMKPLESPQNKLDIYKTGQDRCIVKNVVTLMYKAGKEAAERDIDR